MKKLIACIATALMLVTLTPIQSVAEKKPASISLTGKESPELKAIITRVNEINAMDRSTMSRSERKEIRKELRALKKAAHKHDGGGVYVSAGFIILVLVLIIIF
jgi:hypothetical protein